MSRKIHRPTDHVTCRHCRRDFRAITFWHLRNIHGYDDEHPILEYKRRFRVPSALCGDSRKKLSEAKEFFWERRGQHWTPDDVLTAIRQVYRKEKNLSRRHVPVRLYTAGRRYFGTWETAVQTAGFDFETATGIHRWTPEKIIERIKALAADGEPITGKYVMKHYPYLHQAAITQFPKSWRKALRAAGFEPDEHRAHRGRWDRKSAKTWVRTRVAKQRSILAENAPKDIVRFVHQHLRTGWIAFVESLGIPYPGIKRRRDWTKEKLLDEIRRWKTGGHQMNYHAIKLEYQALIAQARKFFGSWGRACAAAGA